MTVTNNFETNGDPAILQLNHLFEVGERDKRYISTLVGYRGGGRGCDSKSVYNWHFRNRGRTSSNTVHSSTKTF